MMVAAALPTHNVRSATRNRSSRRWRQSRIATAIVAVLSLVFATLAWLSLVFSNTSACCWRHLHRWDGSPLPSPPPPSPHLLRLPTPSRTSPSATSSSASPAPLSSSTAGKTYSSSGGAPAPPCAATSGWRNPCPPTPPSRRFESPKTSPGSGTPTPLATPPASGLRISRIVVECFRLGLADVLWFVLGDDDTIFNVENLVRVLNRYDHREMVYIGSPSANTYFSHSMAFGGGGIAISYPLAEALSRTLDECLERYPKLYGSDDRLHACISELGIPLTRELGFHQCDIRGNAHGLLATHPIAPFVSIHHVEAVDPFYPGLSLLDSLKLFMRAVRADPMSFLQRAICYDRRRRLTFSVSLGYVVQVFPIIVLPRELERSEQTYSAWNRVNHQNEFEFDTRDVYQSVCKKPLLFFLKDVSKEGNVTVGSYTRRSRRDDLKRKVFWFPRPIPLSSVKEIRVLGNPLSENWHLVPRRLCCKVNHTSDELLEIMVGQCEGGISGPLVDSV